MTARDASKGLVVAVEVEEEEVEEETALLLATRAKSATRNEWSATDSGCGIPLRTQPVRLVVWREKGEGQGEGGEEVEV